MMVGIAKLPERRASVPLFSLVHKGVECAPTSLYRGTLLIRPPPSVGPHSSPMMVESTWCAAR